jgi:hypothetical protein
LIAPQSENRRVGIWCGSIGSGVLSVVVVVHVTVDLSIPRVSSVAVAAELIIVDGGAQTAAATKSKIAGLSEYSANPFMA